MKPFSRIAFIASTFLLTGCTSSSESTRNGLGSLANPSDEKIQNLWNIFNQSPLERAASRAAEEARASAEAAEAAASSQMMLLVFILIVLVAIFFAMIFKTPTNNKDKPEEQ